MSSNLVIVAIPDENDRVWKISSEKVPHLTLLFLGEVDNVVNLDQIIQFVEHAASTTLRRFYLPVDRRGELGADQADVLFFKKGRYDYKAIREFRSLLLKDSNIKTAYDSATQFEAPETVGAPGQSWIPHLTLGYPATPAKTIDDDQDYRFYDVCFNKIAVWTGDFDGPEFWLKDYEDEFAALDSVPMDVAMSDLHHHGVKGMKWGVRKAPVEGSAFRGSFRNINTFKKQAPGVLSRRSEVRLALFGQFAMFDSQVRAEVKAGDRQIVLSKQDKKWEKGLKDGSAWVAVNNASADHFNKHIDAINNKYPKDRDWSNEDYAHPKSPEFKKYMKDIHALTRDSIEHATNELDLMNPSGTKKVKIESGGLPGDYRLTVEEVKHADESSIRIKVKYQFDNLGRVTGFTYSDEEPESMTQTADLGSEFLEHFGVKGMRWGVRKEDISGGAKSVGRVAKSAGGKIGKAATEVSRALGDVQFESRLEDETKRNVVNMSIDSKARSAFKRTDLPALKERHGDYGKMINRAKKPFSKEAQAYRKDARETYIKRLEEAANSMTNVSGTRQYTIRERGWELPAEGGALPSSKHFWTVTTREVKHADGDFTWDIEVVVDDEGYISDLKPVENSMAQTVDLGTEWLEHYGVKGMRWGVRNAKGGSNTSGVGETKREGIQKFLDPQGHQLSSDVAKLAIGYLVPVAAPFTWPAQIRLLRGAGRGAAAKAADIQDKRFVKKAMSPKNFVKIHNGALDKINRDIGAINKKYPGDLKNNPAQRKKYDNEVLKAMQDGYRQSANSIGNKRMHLDVEFEGDGADFKIHAREGQPTPQPQRVKHADDGIGDEEITVEITGKIKRDGTDHIIGFEFDHLEPESMAQSAELGEAFILEHYGIKGMRWGVRKQQEVTARSLPDTGILRRKTKVRATGGVSHPAHVDAVKAAVQKQKLKKSGTDALSTQELRDLANRLQVENQVAILTSSKGRQFVSREFETTTKGLAREGFKKAPAVGGKVAKSRVGKKIRKGAATAAVTALI